MTYQATSWAYYEDEWDLDADPACLTAYYKWYEPAHPWSTVYKD